jgi:DMSO/TMAO reductase YedYZ molybdopterin-dependent catalytic subunit
MMIADWPPLLETPLHYFLQDLTPNEAYFVRWHYAGLPTHIDLRTFRTEVVGAVDRPLQLSFDDLRTKLSLARSATGAWTRCLCVAVRYLPFSAICA